MNTGTGLGLTACPSSFDALHGGMAWSASSSPSPPAARSSSPGCRVCSSLRRCATTLQPATTACHISYVLLQINMWNEDDLGSVERSGGLQWRRRMGRPQLRGQGKRGGGLGSGDGLGKTRAPAAAAIHARRSVEHGSSGSWRRTRLQGGGGGGSGAVR